MSVNDSDFFEYQPDELDPRKGRQANSSKRNAEQRPKSLGKAALKRIAARTPEVVVKVASAVRNRVNLNRVVDYICDKGNLNLEDQDGFSYLGNSAREQALKYWGGIPDAEDAKRKEALHVVLSMPEDNNMVVDDFLESARRFAQVEFKGHQYVFSMHTDTERPHVHFMVHMTPLELGKRMNTDREVLQRWRETFAEKLRGLSIEANATSRLQRGVVVKPKKRAVFEIDQKHYDWLTLDPATRPTIQPPLSITTQKMLEKVPRESLTEAVKPMAMEYGKTADAIKHDDPALAMDLVNFGKVMANPVLRYDMEHNKRAELSQDAAQNRQRAPGQGRGPER